ncbi:hypothetical protein [Tessaracoccus coleopterorum]|uniref:hypothetical protein n=1 Tax=Tessaracoccus coleopterorum TaxID=2714950 RepID=UPI0018D4AD2B|nr:hypothetical protein [Tessaracoccus coleopterorum]
MSIDIQIWSDVACPGATSGSAASRRRSPGSRSAIRCASPGGVSSSTRRSPSAATATRSATWRRPRDARAAVEQMVSQVKQVAADEGLDYDFDALVVANSRRAHRVLQAAKLADAADGGDRADALEEGCSPRTSSGWSHR